MENLCGQVRGNDRGRPTKKSHFLIPCSVIHMGKCFVCYILKKAWFIDEIEMTLS
ncbi:MAG: hypothetical protein HFI85_04220 [Clostridia bacterium]|nr:hypothetical protein [Clostridia bacterium]